MKFFIFAGSSEGREISEILSENGFDCVVSVATEYGANLLPHAKNLTVLQGRLSHEEMSRKFSEKNYDYIVDATHPFAVEVSKEIKKACEITGNKYIRLARATNFKKDKDIFYFPDIASAGEWLESQEAKIFVTTGSKELSSLAEKISDKNRLFARVLPSAQSIQICADCGIARNQIIAMQGPFSQKSNEIQFSESGAKILLTKESGARGGFFEKIEAARNLGMRIAVIQNPETAESEDSGRVDEKIFRSKEEFLSFIRIQKNSFPQDAAGKNKKIFLIGFGTGDKNLLTIQAKKAVEESEIVFGSKRILESLDFERDYPGIRSENLYKADEILSYLDENPNLSKTAVLFSGDTGFFSGADGFFTESAAALRKWDLEICSGIPSPVYFAGKLRKSWQNWKMLSLHGAKCNVVEEIRRNPACFFILSGEEDVRSVGKKLEKALGNGVLSEVKCYLGSNLSYDVEKIIQISPKEMSGFLPGQNDGDFRLSENKKFRDLYVLLVENENPSRSVLPILKDEDFIRRDGVPMTKREVRQISVLSLGLSEDSVAYDIGCGSGSVTVEMARVCAEGRVLAIDCDEKALSLTAENVGKFCLENVTLLSGSAPDCLENVEFPPPTHVFIGGSKGNLGKIIKSVLKKNPSARIVANFISLENLCEMREIIKSLEEKNFSLSGLEIRQISVNRAEKIGESHLMRAQNPVYIVSFSGKGGDFGF